MKTFRHIIVGLDFSPASKAALKAAGHMAASDGALLTAVHVIDPKLAGYIKEAHHFSDEQLLKNVGDRVVDFVIECGLDTASVSVDLSVGRPFESLASACERLKADLLVMGTRGSEHAANQIGTVATQCLRKIAADVLLVREYSATPFKQVLVCVDLSETSAKAVQDARHLAEMDGAKLDCLFVYQSAIAMTADYGGFLPSYTEAELASSVEAWRENLNDFLKPLLRTAENLQWQAITVERLNVREAIYDHIRETKADVVVLGTRGKSDLRTFFMGTTAEKIVTHAPCSVLAVKPEDFAKEESVKVEAPLA